MTCMDLTNRKFGRLKAIRRVGTRGNSPLWLCECDCGNFKEMTTRQLLHGSNQSCGCFFRDRSLMNWATSKLKKLSYRHGDYGTRLYGIWHGMKTRCLNPNAATFKNYGGRGITVCEEWKNDYVNFKVWAESNGYEEHLTLERIDNNGDYEPGNCKWITLAAQQLNTRQIKYYSYLGNPYTLRQLSEISGIQMHTIDMRIKKLGWSVEDAVTRPLRRKK